MEEAKEIVEDLIAVGDRFSYQNFSTKTEYGYVKSYTADWIAWRSRIYNIIDRFFRAKSTPESLLKSASSTLLIGNGPEKFEVAKSYYMGALRAALRVLEKDSLGELFEDSGKAVAPLARSNKVFIVHGHDETAKQELEIVLGEMGLEPIVLHRQPDAGRTIIEKFERYADVGFAFVLLTPDELAYLVSEEAKPDLERVKEKRARPNVIFEFGFFVGRLGRERICCIYRGDVVLPNDVQGVIYKRFEKSIEEVAYSVRKELVAAGYNLR